MNHFLVFLAAFIIIILPGSAVLFVTRYLTRKYLGENYIMLANVLTASLLLGIYLLIKHSI